MVGHWRGGGSRSIWSTTRAAPNRGASFEKSVRHGIASMFPTSNESPILILGIVPDAIIGEACHQPRKKTLASGSGRDVALHAIRHEDTRMALRALAERIPYVATTYDRREGAHRIETVIPGQACSRVLQDILPRFDDGERDGSDQSPGDSPSVRESNRRHAGSATWELRLNNGEGTINGALLGEAWQDAVGRGGKSVVPHHETLRQASRL